MKLVLLNHIRPELLPDGIDILLSELCKEMEIIFAETKGGLHVLERADIVCGLGAHASAAVIGEARQLKWLHLLSAGVEMLPFRSLGERGVTVTNSQGLHGPQMAEQIVGTMIAFTRGLHVAVRNQQCRVWDRSYPLDDLRGKRLLIIGAGSIGTEVARKAAAFDMVTYGISRRGQPIPHFSGVTDMGGLPELLGSADYVLVLLPLTDDTRLCIGREQFALMKQTAVLLNFSRGRVVDEEALIEALQQNLIAGAGLDVFHEEPLAQEHPFWTMEQVIMTPHYSGTTRTQGEFGLFRDLLRLYKEGKPVYNTIDLAHGY